MIEDLTRPEGVQLRLLLVRHGEPSPSSRGRCYGKLDVELSEGGREQMRRLGRHIQTVKLDAIYASPRKRALQSARILARQSNVEPLVDERLSEMDFGRLEGMRYDVAQREYPELYARWMQQPTEVAFPGGESFGMMRKRVVAAFAEMRARHRGAMLAIVSHGGVNRILLAHALGLGDDAIFRLGQSYAGVSVVDYFDEASSVVRLLNGVVTC